MFFLILKRTLNDFPLIFVYLLVHKFFTIFNLFSFHKTLFLRLITPTIVPNLKIVNHGQE
jgi:hypothetical protein